MRAIVIMNGSAGSFGKTDQQSDVARVDAAMRKAGIDVEIRAVEPHELSDAAKRAAAERPDAVVAAGGDGTINTVVGALVGGDVPLGVLALGTYNHFAKDLRLPLDLDAAAAVIAGGVTRNVDVGRVNDHVFVNNSSIGMYPSIVKRREKIRERLGRSKFAAMVVATLAIVRRYPLLNVRIHTPQGSMLRRTSVVFIGNNPYNIELFKLGERTSLDSGTLSLYMTHRTGRFAMFWLALRGLFGRLNQANDFESLLLDECIIETPRRHLHVAIDGEVQTLPPPLHYRIVPGGLKVIVAQP